MITIWGENAFFLFITWYNGAISCHITFIKPQKVLIITAIKFPILPIHKPLVMWGSHNNIVREIKA